MAKLNSVVKVTPTQFDNLRVNGSTTYGDSGTHTYDANSLYLVQESQWQTIRLSNSNNTSVPFVDNAVYQLELYDSVTAAATQYSFINLGLVTIPSNGTAQYHRLTLFGVDLYNATTYGRLIRLQIYRQSGTVKYVSVAVNTSTSSGVQYGWSTSGNFTLRYRRVDI